MTPALTAPSSDLHAGRAVRHLFVVAAAAVDDQVEVLGRDPGAGQCTGTRDSGQVDRRHVGDAAFLMPVREMIQSSLVSRKVARSAFERTAGGMHLPQPVTAA